MSARNVRVDIPQRNHLKMITLVRAILQRHSDLGPASPLNDPIIDMAMLTSQHDIHEIKYDEAREFDGFSQALTEEADIALGIDEGQDSTTEGTIYYIVTAIRDRLLLFYKANEEQITTFGFNVVKEQVKGRTSVRVDIPITSPLLMLDLVEKILKRHNNLMPGSPLDTPETDIAALIILQATHNTKRKEASEQDALAQAAMEEARIALGTDDGQTSRTKGTVYSITTEVRDKLLAAHRNHEEQISTYGFNVVISMTSFPGEGPTAISGSVNAAETLGIYDEVSDSSGFILANTGTVPLLYCRSAIEGTPCDPATSITVNPGEEIPATGLELGATGNWLNVTNSDPTTLGKFSVVVNS